MLSIEIKAYTTDPYRKVVLAILDANTNRFKYYPLTSIVTRPYYTHLSTGQKKVNYLGFLLKSNVNRELRDNDSIYTGKGALTVRTLVKSINKAVLSKQPMSNEFIFEQGIQGLIGDYVLSNYQEVGESVVLLSFYPKS